MPSPQQARYNLQHGTANPNVPTTDCGTLVVSMSNDTPPLPVFQYLRCAGNPNGPTISTAVYTHNGSGNGTATNPDPGDTLTLGGFQVTGDDGVLYQFNGTATYTASGGGGGKGGYFTSGASPTAGAGDWDAEDPGTPDPKGKS